MSELAKMRERSGIVGACCRFFVGKRSNVYLSPPDNYPCAPLSVRSRDASQSGTGIFVDTGVGNILRPRAWANVLSSVIESVAIFVVYIAIRVLQEFAVHEDHGRIIIPSACSIKPLNVFVPYSEPVGSGECGIIRRIYYRILALSERDKADRLVLRLDNSVTLHVEFHDLTSNEIAKLFSRFLFYQKGTA